MSILRSSVVVSSITMISRVFGFARDMAIANRLGASTASDAFFVALMIPNLLRRLFAEGAFNVVFVPILSRMQEGKGKEAAEKFASACYTWLAAILLCVTVLAEFFMPQLIAHVISPGWADDPERLTLATQLGRITFPYLMLITFASLAGGICNTYGKFAPFALVPILWNIAIIVSLFTFPYLGVSEAMAGAFGILIGGGLQMMYMWYALRKLKFTLKLTKDFREHEEMGTLFRRIGPAALGMGILQLSFLIDTMLASYLEGNAISYLQFANRFYQQPLSMIGIALATVLLPHLSRSLKSGDKADANKTFTGSLTYGLALALASTVGLYILALPLIETMLGHGKFTVEDSLMVSKAMQAYCLALPAFVVTKVTLTCFYANEDTRTPLYISAISLAINVVANIVLMNIYGFVGIAMATAFAGWSNAAMQLYMLHKQKFIAIDNMKNFRIMMLKTAVITAAMWGILLSFVSVFPAGESTLYNLLWLGAVVVLGVVVFLGLSQILKFFDVKDVLANILKRKKA